MILAGKHWAQECGTAVGFWRKGTVKNVCSNRHKIVFGAYREMLKD